MRKICVMLAAVLFLLPTAAQAASASDAEQQEITAQAAQHTFTVSSDFDVPYSITSTDKTDIVDIVTVQLSDSAGNSGKFIFACETQTDATGTQFQCDYVNHVVL